MVWQKCFSTSALLTFELDGYLLERAHLLCIVWRFKSTPGLHLLDAHSNASPSSCVSQKASQCSWMSAGGAMFCPFERYCCREMFDLKIWDLVLTRSRVCSWELGGWANRENIIESEKFEELRPSSDQKIKIIFKKSSSLFKDYFLRTVVVHSLMILKKLSSLRRREEKYKMLTDETHIQIYFRILVVSLLAIWGNMKIWKYYWTSCSPFEMKYRTSKWLNIILNPFNFLVFSLATNQILLCLVC